ncbi:M15 family metallopeptidase [Kineococcus sp. NBC_00420]|uniref:M15 family metallopeptidase n=1 Tax=Kineococcus sp. NBC_00420 TaxID=2903564 RepID=UPI002E221B93
MTRGSGRSPFAPDVLPDGRRRYSHRAVVARRTLLVGVVAAGTSIGVVATRAGGVDDSPGVVGVAGGDPAVHDAAAQPAPSATPPAHSLTEAGSPWVIVNKQHPIAPHDYAPEIAVVGGKEVASTIAADLQGLLAAAKSATVSLGVTSGFRSLAHQQDVHDNAVARDGVESAESVSARPGYSEHQTGLAVDFSGSSRPGCLLENCFGQTPEYDWLVANAGRFGFLRRYPDDKTDVTGYAPEPWHWRWVGTDLVAQMAAKGVTTMEEFFGVSGGSTYA